MKASDLVRDALAEVGVTEYPANSNNVKYNSWYYGHDVSGSAYPWCAAFVSWLFRTNRDLCPRTASCQEMLAWFEKNGRVVAQPEAGDIVFFKYSTNSRRTNHVGIVVGISGNKISTVEGNTSISSDDNGGAVMQRTRTNHIVAYARPMYDGVPDNITPAYRGDIPIELFPTIKIGAKGLWVVFLQQRLNAKGIKVDVDGDFGQKTRMAVIAFQGMSSLTKDGVVGQKSWHALCE